MKKTIKYLRESVPFRIAMIASYAAVIQFTIISVEIGDSKWQRLVSALVGVSLLLNWLIGWICLINLISVIRDKDSLPNWEHAARWNAVPVVLGVILIILVRHPLVVMDIPYIAFELIRGGS